MNGVGLTTVGRLLGHRQRETTAIYAHLDDTALRDAAAQAAAVIARAMGYRAERCRCPTKRKTGILRRLSQSFRNPVRRPRQPECERPFGSGPETTNDRADGIGRRRRGPPRRRDIDWLGDDPIEAKPGSAPNDHEEPSTPRDPLWY